MTAPIVISPSILSADFMNLEREVRAIEAAGADWVHVDVMDGHFVPNLTIGAPVAAQLAGITDLPLDIHLMISNPLVQLDWYLAAKPGHVTIHWEALDPDRANEQAREAIERIHGAGAKAGIALKPDTDVEVLRDTIGAWDMVLVMSVFPGFSGQSYLPESAGRVAAVRAMAGRDDLVIQVDGGIGEKTAPLVAEAGATSLVAGNAVFKAESYDVAIRLIRDAARSAAEAGR